MARAWWRLQPRQHEDEHCFGGGLIAPTHLLDRSGNWTTKTIDSML